MTEPYGQAVSENVSVKQIKTHSRLEGELFVFIAVSMEESRPTILSQTVGRGVHDPILREIFKALDRPCQWGFVSLKRGGAISLYGLMGKSTYWLIASLSCTS